MSKIVMTISTDLQTKKMFMEYAKDMWTNMTNLLNMFMKNAPRSKKLEFYSPIEEVKPEKWEKDIIDDYNKQVKDWTFQWVEFQKFFDSLKKKD